ncbi:DUF4215 domain-containing protein [Anaeromyxobacter oryzisoli]|uniref:DUF4215 domain-containing protein n=1 Tax=Anaeromyxobacter oryzisoli TaxID=2925408 RepID=UPI001F56155D|nr:DUF4215 domain-containing protein [Anaeromyxobacter sp. SG63]
MRFELLQGNGGARGGIAALAMAIAAVMVSGCRLESKSTLCPTGVYCPPGAKCAAAQAVCIWENCGDGILQDGEVCDDGNLIDGDGCSHDCKSDETCGNTVTDKIKGEECDDGNTANGDGCSSDCKSEKCGNHVIDAGEDCDDAGETVRCNANCTWSRHGDGTTNAHAGEQCDGGVPALDGTVSSCESATCNWNCTWSRHGDGIVNGSDGEVCDGGVPAADGSVTSCESAICNANCTWSRHGDGIVNATAGEQCDGGVVGGSSSSCESATCNANCTWSRHGDGIVNATAGEQCDGGVVGGSSSSCESATCNWNCTPSRCGDTIVNVQAGEQCDDGNLDDEDDCISCKAATCGDKIVDRHGPLHVEACDLGTALNGKTDCAYGLLSCEGCASNCAAPLATVKHWCGDYVQETGLLDPNGAIINEQCDNALSFACGTCSGKCQTILTGTAKGQIEVKSTAGTDGTLITLGDQTRTATIEIRMSSGVCALTSDGCAVVSQANPAPKDIAGAIRTEVTRLNNAGLLPVHLRSTNNDQFVRLEHDGDGVAGNRAIVVSPPDQTSLGITDMSGGAGCVTGEACATDADCVTGICSGTSGVCL